MPLTHHIAKSQPRAVLADLIPGMTARGAVFMSWLRRLADSDKMGNEAAHSATAQKTPNYVILYVIKIDFYLISDATQTSAF